MQSSILPYNVTILSSSLADLNATGADFWNMSFDGLSSSTTDVAPTLSLVPVVISTSDNIIRGAFDQLVSMWLSNAIELSSADNTYISYINNADYASSYLSWSIESLIASLSIGLSSTPFTSSVDASTSLSVRIGSVNVILFDETSRLLTGMSCYLVCSTFFFRVIARSDVLNCIVSPIGRIYNIFDRNVSIDLTKV
jgi:hypothetical protein